MSDTSGPHRVEPPRGGGLRAALAHYVLQLHRSYLAAAGGVAQRLPLASGPFTVAVVAADRLHLLATRDPLPAALAHERPTAGQEGPLVWQVRFLDASVVPGLARGEASRLDVPAELGVEATLYHLLVEVNATLDDHHAMHAGTGLAHAHLATLEGGA